MSSPIDLPIKRKRQICACDNCRRSKRKCDGKIPCERCNKQGKTCLYTPKKRNKTNIQLQIQKKEQEKIKQQYETIIITEDHKKHLDLYFSNINPGLTMIGYNTLKYTTQNLYDKSIQLQFYSIIAISLRTIGDIRYHEYSFLARQLACELFDTFNLENAFAFYCYSFYIWGENIIQACHYRDITLSICNRIITSNNRAGFPILFLQLKLVHISQFEKITVEVNLMNQIISRFDCSQISNPFAKAMIELVKFEMKLIPYVFKDKYDPEYLKNPFKIINNELAKELFDILLNVESSFKTTRQQHNTSHSSVSRCWNYFFKSIVYYASKNIIESIKHIKLCFSLLEQNSTSLSIINPKYICLCHFSFIITHLECEIVLGERILEFFEKLVSKLPSAQPTYLKDVDSLKLLKSQLLELSTTSNNMNDNNDNILSNTNDLFGEYELLLPFIDDSIFNDINNTSINFGDIY